MKYELSEAEYDKLTERMVDTVPCSYNDAYLRLAAQGIYPPYERLEAPSLTSYKLGTTAVELVA